MRDMIYRQIMERGFHPKREALVQHYDTDVLDASLLYMPLVGFVAPTDPMWQSTLRATICSFWYVDALARRAAWRTRGSPSRRC
jgi:GH15 family glucan-1,4-alpha-glucosidase